MNDQNSLIDENQVDRDELDEMILRDSITKKIQNQYDEQNASHTQIVHQAWQQQISAIQNKQKNSNQQQISGSSDRMNNKAPSPIQMYQQQYQSPSQQYMSGNQGNGGFPGLGRKPDYDSPALWAYDDVEVVTELNTNIDQSTPQASPTDFPSSP
ncbi:MAG: hypothetical protein EZS28_056229, partial [Streblomastix strix]